MYYYYVTAVNGRGESCPSKNTNFDLTLGSDGSWLAVPALAIAASGVAGVLWVRHQRQR
jgi:hypothetical protein